MILSQAISALPSKALPGLPSFYPCDMGAGSCVGVGDVLG